MRHRYHTRGIILSRVSVGESSLFLTLLTPDLGLIRALAQGVRKSGAKLAPALTTLAESECVLVRGKDGWRIAGAVLYESWYHRMNTPARERVARVFDLLLRLVAGEERNVLLYPIHHGFLSALATEDEEIHESIEILAALRMLATLGLDSGAIPGDRVLFSRAVAEEVGKERTHYIGRINQGIAASGL